MPARVIETSLFAGGGVGTITVEGPGRNPSTTDLIAEFYAILHEHTGWDRSSSITMTPCRVRAPGTAVVH